ncbi:hypothetical protein [Coxiella-like endosymbiont]|nr:hypothetical protein [Coxiella-like endosymbiont]
MNVLATLLGGIDSSRFSRDLVRENQIANMGPKRVTTLPIAQ